MEKTIHLLITYTFLIQSILLLHKGRNSPKSSVLAIYSIIQVITNAMISITLTYGDFLLEYLPVSHIIYKPFYCLWVPVFYLYVKTYISNNYKYVKNFWPHTLPFILFLIIDLGILLLTKQSSLRNEIYTRGSFIFNISQAIDVTIMAQYVFYNMLLIKELRSFGKSLKYSKLSTGIYLADLKWARFMVYSYVFGCLLNFLVLFHRTFNYDFSVTLNLFSISYFYLFFFILFYKTISTKNLLSVKSSKLTIFEMPPEEVKQILNKIENKILESRLYLNPELSLKHLATVTGEKERTISYAINSVKHRNFNDFINFFRIENAKKELQEHPEKAIFEIMYDSGFSTKGAFNLVFKKSTGLTPSEFRKKYIL